MSGFLFCAIRSAGVMGQWTCRVYMYKHEVHKGISAHVLLGGTVCYDAVALLVCVAS